MRVFLRRTLDILRWPLGVFALFGLPSALRITQSVASPIFRQEYLWFWTGLILVILFWYWRGRHSNWGRFITTIEHEALHALIGMLTLIPIREMKVRDDGSGHVLFAPPGHWLLYLAPYFIPLLLLLEVGLLRLLQLPGEYEKVALGAILGLSLFGHVRQIHPRQTDFRQAGVVFTLAFLPTAFILAYSTAFCVLLGGGPKEVFETVGSWYTWTLRDFSTLLALVQDQFT